LDISISRPAASNQSMRI